MELSAAQCRAYHERTKRGMRTLVVPLEARADDPEDWKTVPEFERYQVSTRGRVRSWRNGPTGAERTKPRILKQSVSVKGFMQVCFILDGKKSTKSVHALVLETWLGKRPRGWWCHHLDGNRTNNNLANLGYRAGGKRGI